MRLRCLITVSTATVLGWTSAASTARAEAQGAASTSELWVVMWLVLGVAGAYFAAHFLVERIQHRFLIVAGAEYLLLGALLGPLVPWATATMFGPSTEGPRLLGDLQMLLPAVYLATGWFGLLRGMELNLRAYGSVPAGAMRIAVGYALGTAGVVAAAFWWLFTSPEVSAWLGWQLQWPDHALSAAIVGCCAAAGATGPIDLLTRRYQINGSSAALLRRAARLGDFLAILAFGIVFCVFHRDPAATPWTWRPTEWAALSLGLGLGLGLLFTPLVGGQETPNRRFVVLVGIITFASGAAYLLKLDPLIVNLMLGFALINAAQHGTGIRTTLERTEAPMSLVLLVFAGALWEPVPWLSAAATTAAFIVARLLGRVLSGVLVGWGSPFRMDLFRGMLGHGRVTIAMAVSFQLVYDGLAVNLTYTALLASVVLHDLIAPRALRALLVDLGEIQHDPRDSTSTLPQAA